MEGKDRLKKLLRIKKEEPADPKEKTVSLNLSKPSRSTEPKEAVELTEEAVLEVLKTVRDPEIPIDIVNLGLIYDVGVKGANVHVKMTLTTPGCGMGAMISRQAEDAIKAMGANNVIVEIVWDPPWNQDMMSDYAKERLGFS